MQLTKQCCVILAAGEGKRMHAPGSKVLCEVAFKPLLQWVIDAARGAGIADICVVTSNSDVQKAAEGCEIAIQQERLGTGHAVMCAREFFQNREENILILYGDAPFIDRDTIEKSFEEHLNSGSDVTVVSAVTAQPRGYGRIVRKDGQLSAIVEDRDCDESQRVICEINSGTYWFRTQSLVSVLGKIRNDNAQGEYYLTDAVRLLLEQGKRAGCYMALTSDPALGANSPRELLRLNEIANKKIIEKHLDAGVHFQSLDGVLIHPDAVIEPGAKILPGCILKKGVRIGAACEIGPNTVLENTSVGKGSRLESCVCEDAVVGEDARLGPFVHLRPGTVIGDRAKVGNFVEVKNSSVGEGTSIAHLTYVGDADVGRYCNFGCGVVFVNYDGEKKSRTVVRDYAFIGGNTNLIAPVTVGEGAYTAAGATITKDVPDGALAIDRSEQVNKPDWGNRKLSGYRAKKSKTEKHDA